MYCEYINKTNEKHVVSFFDLYIIAAIKSLAYFLDFVWHV